MPIGLTDWQLRVLSLPTALRIVVTIGPSLPFLLCIPEAIAGDAGTYSGLVGALIGVAVAAWWTSRDVSHLDRSGRWSVLMVTLTGQPSGRRDVDAVAWLRLQRAARTPRAVALVVGVVLIAVVIATPLIAARRSGSEWWLLGWVSIPLILLVTPLEAFAGNARLRLRSLSAGMDRASAE